MEALCMQLVQFGLEYQIGMYGTEFPFVHFISSRWRKLATTPPLVVPQKGLLPYVQDLQENVICYFFCHLLPLGITEMSLYLNWSQLLVGAVNELQPRSCRDRVPGPF